MFLWLPKKGAVCWSSKSCQCSKQYCCDCTTRTVVSSVVVEYSMCVNDIMYTYYILETLYCVFECSNVRMFKCLNVRGVRFTRDLSSLHTLCVGGLAVVPTRGRYLSCLLELIWRLLEVQKRD